MRLVLAALLDKPFQALYNTFKRCFFDHLLTALSPERRAKEGTRKMPTIRLETLIAASPVRCFDLSLSVDLHRQSVGHTHERPIAGVTTGIMKLGDTVTWEAVHFGIKQHLTSKITAYERPRYFRDEMVRGIFKEINHFHEFIPQPEGTLMVDTFTFRAPPGVLGRLAETLVLTHYMKGLLLARNSYLKSAAESADTNSGM